MYLSKLEIVGFKSFAQKTLLKFTGGISAVVGPNGCGKTNIVDAIRWVLGEQKTSVLRSDVMENVIFNGTKSRKPLSMAEVTLTIENTKNILPTEYSEVTITRRLYRSGESEYLLNKTKCRLRDIIDLFMDTGLGSDSYSVIELKMVEAILSGRAEERRALFEEAAGIKKYKMRRKETAKKLEAVLGDLTRVQDILDEVRKNVNSLSRQAQKTRRYNALMTEFKELEIKLLDFQLETLGKNIGKLNNDINELNKQKIKFEFDISSFEESLTNLKEKFSKADEEYRTASNNENILISKIADKKREVAVASEKLASIDQSKDRTISEISDAESSKEQASKELEELLAELSGKNSDKSKSAEELFTRKEQRDTHIKSLREAKSFVDKSNESVYSIQSSINNIRNQINRSGERKSMLEKKIQGSFEESHKIQSQIDQIDSEIEQSGDIKSQLAEDLTEAECLLTSEKERQTDLNNELDALKLKISDRKNILSTKNSALDYLKSLIDTNETAKYLIKSDNWCNSPDKIQLAEAVAVDDEYRIATISALNFIGDFFLVDTIAEAQKAIDLLKNEQKGRTAVIARELCKSSNNTDFPASAGIIGNLTDMLRCDDNTRNILNNLLGRCAVTNDLESAINAVKAGNLDAAVALSGEFVHHSGYIFGGSFKKNDSGKLGKKEKMDTLKKEIASLKEDIAQLEKNADDLKLEISDIDIQSLTTNVRACETKLKNFEQKQAQLELRRQALEQSLQLVSESNSRLEAEIDDILKDLEFLQENLNSNTIELEKAKEDLKIKQSELANAEILLRKSEESLKAVEIDIARINSEISAGESEKRRINSLIASLSSSIQRKQEELLNSDRTKDELAEKIESNSTLLAEFESEIELVKNSRDFFLQDKNSLSEQITQHSQSLSDIRKQFDSTKESVHEKEIKLSELQTQLNIVNERMVQDYQIELENHVIEIPEDFNPEQSKALITELKSKLANLGNVNFLALEEYEKENERLNFYENQINDLLNSEKTLKETIAEINQTAERHFVQTFEKIHENFKKLFQTLFGEEGEAELRIDTNNVLETDIEIMAKPPNKRPNSIEQLSGGEKTLTAIALLFAIYLVKPSPFCILDEVDAPLDDANVEKFVKLIKEFSFDTQFLIVSHNKKTMTAADTLYGVTMQEVGVSKTVSVALNQTDLSF